MPMPSGQFSLSLSLRVSMEASLVAPYVTCLCLGSNVPL